MLKSSLRCATIALLLSFASLTLAHAQVAINVDWRFPADISGGAPNATLQQAAAFAWQEFIALSWPAELAGKRDEADQSQKFGAGGNGSPLVWQTFRGKAEIFNLVNVQGNFVPPGYSTTAPNYGYDSPTAYFYRGQQVAPCSGQTPPTTPAWINLDETTQISLAQMFAGGPTINNTNSTVPQLIRYAVKANGVQYGYVAKNQFFDANTAQAARAINTAAFTATPPRAPMPTSTSPFVSFPMGTVEVKSAWRALTSNDDPTHFHRQTVRFYENKDNVLCYFEEQWGLVALHIIQKTPSAPSFIYATFEQGENIKQPTSGASVLVEDLDGNVVNPVSGAGPTTPSLSYSDSPTTPKVTANGGPCTTNNALYFKDKKGAPGLTGGIEVCVNQRYESIPADVIGVNKAAHQAIADYNSANQVQNSPWPYYKLVSVQAVPFDDKAISNSDPTHLAAVFFLANIVVETNYTLQQFQGRIASNDAPTTFPGQVPLNLPPNVFTVTGSTANGVNMGGCMGCHGNAQVTKGSDFSFILAEGSARAPETPSALDGLGSAEVTARYRNLFR
jgi:hypothetical protein